MPDELKALVPPDVLTRGILDEDTIETCVAKGMTKTDGYRTRDLDAETKQWLGDLLVGLEVQEPHHPLLTEYAKAVTGSRRKEPLTKEQIEQELPAQGNNEQTRAFRIIKALLEANPPPLYQSRLI